ncbi:hypothetical protein PIB30_010910 [Stylosanthes scabra]|uniref:FAS1 domain-containing protein n=1 Tax=Stylosanthes scabra TaxID=79078 RepID=A0ABU6T5G6_9FABA|nr:hypothetical protein [Stylosanthes scabra]
MEDMKKEKNNVDAHYPTRFPIPTRSKIGRVRPLSCGSEADEDPLCHLRPHLCERGSIVVLLFLSPPCVTEFRAAVDHHGEEEIAPLGTEADPPSTGRVADSSATISHESRFGMYQFKRLPKSLSRNSFRRLVSGKTVVVMLYNLFYLADLVVMQGGGNMVHVIDPIILPDVDALSIPNTPFPMFQ